MDDDIFKDLLATGGNTGGASGPQPGQPSTPALTTGPSQQFGTAFRGLQSAPGMFQEPNSSALTLPNSNSGFSSAGATGISLQALQQRYTMLLMQRQQIVGFPPASTELKIQQVARAIARDGEGARPKLEKMIRVLEKDINDEDSDDDDPRMPSARRGYGPWGGTGGGYPGFGFFGGFGGFGF
ncbi:hypothetical protein B0A55_05205 [Friedmanniomyces simplex]|uniref:Uncharacterized protein n=1 Tax=Friedmanniomyces simplex TaxID=329884 RepID=A0A4U0XBY3_9PEZI|nr:hypothetical protein B0A55_05205 [Friedmanniomyces simplex]